MPANPRSRLGRDNYLTVTGGNGRKRAVLSSVGVERRA